MKLKMKPLISLFIILFLIIPSSCCGKNARHKSKNVSYRYAEKTYKIKRDKKGHIKRSLEAKHEFWRLSGYPHGRKGYVVDHIIPLACGGANMPSNMQWQTKAEGKAKDKWERKGCSKNKS
ncbi:MAG: HNH endonuclease [Nitrospirae bacterium]|nr:HNH endonuclease [Nitrospirota bacterium]